MRFFSSSHWLFSVKTFAAGLMALAVSFSLDLPRPYWALATVYIASQPLSGATRSKAVYRAAGTLLGGAGAVLMVPNLVGAPLVLALAMSLWSGACLYLALLDRTPRGYVFMLAGYTAAIVGFPAVDAPETIFDLALSRSEEILVGIGCAALVSSLLFPRSVGPVVAERLEAWAAHARAVASDACRRGGDGAAEDAHWLRLVTDMAEIETLAAHLAFDPAVDRRSLDGLRRLVPRMMMLFPVLSAIADRIGALSSLGGSSDHMSELVGRARTSLDAIDDQTPDALRRDLAVAASPRPQADWRQLLEASLALRLRDLLDLLSDCRRLTKALASGAPAPGPLRFSVDAPLERVRCRDHGSALHAAFTLACALFSSCLFWILSAWPDGATAAMMAAISGSLYASQDDPAPSIAGFTHWSVLATMIAGLYLFVILPQAHSFETLALALAPICLFFGLLTASPQTLGIGLPLAIVTPTALALQELYAAEPESFVNSSLAMCGGMALTAAATALIRPAGARWRARRYMRANRTALAQAAAALSGADEERLTGAMLDRLFLLAPIAHVVGHRMPEALRDLRIGLNVLDARRARRSIADFPRRRVDALLIRLSAHFRRGGDAPPEAAMRAIDRALEAARRGGDDRLLLALVGLRRSLFPRAPAPNSRMTEVPAT